VVALWHGSRERKIPTVSVDNAAGISAVVDHLVGLGHERIALVRPAGLGDIAEREQAYLASMHAHGQVVADGSVEVAANDYGGGAAAFGRLRQLVQPPTAIVALTDVLAIGVLIAAQSAGLRVPADLSVTGFDDIPAARVAVPSLTTVRMPTAAMVRAAIDLAIGDDDPERDRHPVFEPELIVRASTGEAGGVVALSGPSSRRRP
jgi:LacI family transcriptional regulator